MRTRTSILSTATFVFIVSTVIAQEFPNDKLYGPRYRPLWKKGAKTQFTKKFGRSSIRDLVEGAGFIYENYTVQTEDGYLLNLNRMIHPDKVGEAHKGYPLFLLQGLAMQSDAWFVHDQLDSNSGPIWGALGYDVWMGDTRGTVRSRKHVNLTVKDKEMWDYSNDEVGLYDTAAFVDFVLEKTGHKNLVLICLSLGCSLHAMLVSEKPAYNEKILGAMYFMPLVNNIRKEVDLPIGHLPGFHLVRAMNAANDMRGMGEFFPSIAKYKKEVFHLCSSYKRMVHFIFKLQFTDAFHFPVETICSAWALSLGGANVKSARHVLQMYTSGEFAKYDYGREGNLEHYGQELPPLYDLSKITSFVALYYSDGDGFTSLENVKKTLKSFSGPTYECLIPNVSHFDFAAGTTIKYILPDVNQVLDSLTGYAHDNQTKAMSKKCPSMEWMRRLRN